MTQSSIRKKTQLTVDFKRKEKTFHKEIVEIILRVYLGSSLTTEYRLVHL